MHLNVFQVFNDHADQNGLLFYYHGVMTPHVVGTMGEALRTRLQEQAAGGAVARRLFSSFVEMAQNIVNYGVPEDEAGQPTRSPDERYGELAVGQQPDRRYYVVCGNLVQQCHVECLRAKLDRLREMSREHIRQAYREQLHSTSHEQDNPGSRGAGLGLLTLARDASEPIEYRFAEVGPSSPQRSYFFLKATI